MDLLNTYKILLPGIKEFRSYQNQKVSQTLSLKAESSLKCYQCLEHRRSWVCNVWEVKESFIPRK